MAINHDGITRFIGLYTDVHEAGKIAKEARERIAKGESIDYLMDVSKLRSNFNGGQRFIYFNKKTKKWQVSITINRKRVYFGSYSTIDEAVKVRNEAYKMARDAWNEVK